MKREDAVKLVEVVEDLGWEASLYEHYSGRGMFGKTTTGVVLEMPESIANDLESNSMEEYAEMIRNYRSDSLGYDTIIY